MPRSPSLIETVRVRAGAAPLWHLHLRRLVASCRALGIPFPLEFEVPAGGADRVHRLEVGPRGLTVSERPVGPTTPVRLALVETCHRPYPHKTTERDVFDRARAEAEAQGADDALLLTAGGEVAECAIWSVFWWEDGALAAPPLSLGVLPGVARARLEELAGGLSERAVPPAGLEQRGLFVANAVRGVVPVASIDGKTVVPDPRTADLMAQFWT